MKAQASVSPPKQQFILAQTLLPLSLPSSLILGFEANSPRIDLPVGRGREKRTSQAAGKGDFFNQIGLTGEKKVLTGVSHKGSMAL